MSENKNKFEEKIDDLKDWQDNQYNIGKYYDPNQKPNLFKIIQGMPLLFIVMGVMMLILAVVIVIKGISFTSIVQSLGLIFLGVAFIIGGQQRLKRQSDD